MILSFKKKNKKQGNFINSNDLNDLNMDRQKRITICEKKDSNYLARFDKIIDNGNRSNSILKILTFFIDYDMNYIRNILELNPLTENEIQAIKDMAQPKQDQVKSTATSQPNNPPLVIQT